MSQRPDDTDLAEIEAHAVRAARRAGAILAGHFGSRLQVEYKDEHKSDPVTVADKDAQKYLVDAISDRFPDHGILAEEDPDDDAIAHDLTWVLDPLDGTRNFMSGLPVYACSVGVLYKGAPVAGALFLPWPNADSGIVLHARKDGGAFKDGEPITLEQDAEAGRSAIAGLPASFGASYRFKKAAWDKVGEPRVTGSIAYELGMVALGVLQYSVLTAPKLWDVAGGGALITESGGLVMRGQKSRGMSGLLGRAQWKPVEALVTSWESGATTHRKLRRWSVPLVLGSPGAVRRVTENLRRRTSVRRSVQSAVRRTVCGGQRSFGRGA